MAFEHQRRK